MKWVVRFALFLLLLITPFYTHSAPLYKVDYEIDYYPQLASGDTTKTHVAITITNLSDTTYVDTFNFQVPARFDVSNVQVTDDRGFVLPQVESQPNATSITMKFSDPHIGRLTTNTFKLSFDQKNLFKQNGKIWEAILPIANSETTGRYQILVHVPLGADKLSIAKPLPTSIQNNIVTWDNPKTKIVYAVFGPLQTYRMHLNYHIQNVEKKTKNIEIAIPPDTPYQSLYLDEILPLPQSVRQDEDGNYLASYTLAPGEREIVQLGGFIDISSQANDIKRSLDTNRFESQKSYLLNSNPYWNVPLKDARSYTLQTIFESVVGRLSYNFEAIAPGRKRLGAKKALEDSKNALCTEYTDVLVSFARSAGMHTREIEGYGYTQDDRLRPISTTDILHAWAQIYDPDQEEWKSVDPTWTNTSGINYFDSLDLNHIVFAIHGKDPVYPLPAGAYKFTNTQDVIVEPTKDTPQARISFKLIDLTLASKIQDKQVYKGQIVVQNTGNTYRYDVPIGLASNHIRFDLKQPRIATIAPFETVLVPFEYKVAKSVFKQTKGDVIVNLDGSQIGKASITVFPQAYSLTLILGGIVLVVLYGVWLLIGRLR